MCFYICRNTTGESRNSSGLNLIELNNWEKKDIRMFAYGFYSASKKIPPPRGLVAIFPKRLGIFQQILSAYCAFLSTLEYKFLFNYLQLWRSYAILSVTTQFTSCAQDVHHQLKCTLAFSDIFPKRLRIFSPNFTHLLNVHTYARMQIFIHLCPTVTKLCHIKCDHPACV